MTTKEDQTTLKGTFLQASVEHFPAPSVRGKSITISHLAIDAVIPEPTLESDDRRAFKSDPAVELVLKAADVIGPDRFAKWMQTPNSSLNGSTPYALVESEQGREQVERVLGQIEHGIY